jgi:hypothetical protein
MRTTHQKEKENAYPQRKFDAKVVAPRRVSCTDITGAFRLEFAEGREPGESDTVQFWKRPFELSEVHERAMAVQGSWSTR